MAGKCNNIGKEMLKSAKPSSKGKFLWQGKEITPKQYAFISHYLDASIDNQGRIKFGPAFGIAAKAAELAGYNCTSRASFAVTGWEILNKLNISIAELMNNASLDEGRIVKVLDRLLEAKKKHFFQKDGLVQEERISEDNVAQQRALETLIKLRQYANEHGQAGIDDPDVYYIQLPPIREKEKEPINEDTSENEDTPIKEN